MAVPRDTPGHSAPRTEIHTGGMGKRRILLEPHTGIEMRVIRRVSQVVIKPARAGIGPVENLLDGFEAVGFFVLRPDLRRSSSAARAHR